jgi:hypothetical protein
MTVRDRELLELLRDEPELLALADAVAETQATPRRRRLPIRAPGFAALGVAVTAVVLAVLLVPDRVARPSVIGRALAAIGNGRVLHLRTEAPLGITYIDLATGHRTVVMVRNEVWYDRETQRFHYLMEAYGKVGDIVWPDDAEPGTTFEGAVDPAFAALWSGYRQALENGTAKLEREAVVDGRPVYWLRFPSGTEVAIDRTTYKPVLFREHYPNGQQVDGRVLIAETTDYREADFKRRGPDLFGDIGTVGGGFSLDEPLPKPVVKPPWLTAGDTILGLPLAAASASTQTNHRGLNLHGLILIYGDVHRLPEELTIEQFRRPLDPDFWNRIPRGAVAVQRGSAGAHKPQPQWTGSLVKDGIYVEISTTRGEQALLEVARALRRAG